MEQEQEFCNAGRSHKILIFRQILANPLKGMGSKHEKLDFEDMLKTGITPKW